MKTLLAVLALIMMIQVQSVAQKDIPTFDGYHKNIYVEALGSSIGLGVNFDMRLEKGRLDGMGVRAGIGGISFSNSSGDNLGIVTFPLEFNYLVGNGRNSLVAGVGLLPAYASVRITDDISDNLSIDLEGFGVAGGFVNFGYRLQPRNRGFMFQINWNPLILRGDGFNIGWFGIGMGIGFK
jgi:hypothetical protein